MHVVTSARLLFKSRPVDIIHCFEEIAFISRLDGLFLYSDQSLVKFFPCVFDLESDLLLIADTILAEAQLISVTSQSLGVV